MDKDQIVKIIHRRLNLEDQEWSLIEKQPQIPATLSECPPGIHVLIRR